MADLTLTGKTNIDKLFKEIERKEMNDEFLTEKEKEVLEKQQKALEERARKLEEKKHLEEKKKILREQGLLRDKQFLSEKADSELLFDPAFNKYFYNDELLNFDELYSHVDWRTTDVTEPTFKSIAKGFAKRVKFVTTINNRIKEGEVSIKNINISYDDPDFEVVKWYLFYLGTKPYVANNLLCFLNDMKNSNAKGKFWFFTGKSNTGKSVFINSLTGKANVKWTYQKGVDYSSAYFVDEDRIILHADEPSTIGMEHISEELKDVASDTGYFEVSAKYQNPRKIENKNMKLVFTSNEKIPSNILSEGMIQRFRSITLTGDSLSGENYEEFKKIDIEKLNAIYSIISKGFVDFDDTDERVELSKIISPKDIIDELFDYEEKLSAQELFDRLLERDDLCSEFFDNLKPSLVNFSRIAKKYNLEDEVIKKVRYFYKSKKEQRKENNIIEEKTYTEIEEKIQKNIIDFFEED